MEPGEFAMRGGLVDLYPPGTPEPVRLDLFGDVLEAIRSFDPMSQRSTGERDEVVLLPVSEVLLTKESIARFRGGYRELFGNVAGDDSLYEAVSAGQRHVGMEHWLPLFHERLETLLDYCPEAVVTADHQIAEAFAGAPRADHRLLRRPPEDRRQGRHERRRRLQAACRPSGSTSSRRNGTACSKGHAVGAVHQLRRRARRAQRRSTSAAAAHEGFAQARTAQGVNLFDEVAEHVKAGERRGPARRGRGLHRGLGEPPAASAAGARRHDAGAGAPTSPRCRACRPARSASPSGRSSTASCCEGLEVIGEEDMLGDRLSRPAKKRRPSERFIAEAGGAQRRRPGRPSRARRRPLRGPGDARDPERARTTACG